MKIRKVKKDELKAVLELQYLTYQTEAKLYNDFSIPPLTQTLEELESEVNSGLCLVADEEDQIIGSVRAKLSEGVCKIGKLIVSPQKQGKGIGSSLMKTIECAFPNASAFEVFTGHKSVANIRLYKKLGYDVVRKEQLNEKVDLFFLSKPNT